MLHLLFGSRSVAISVMTLSLFPGTVLHELSHLFTAEILGVRTGRLELTPEGIEQEEVRTGSVAIAETDPFRRTAIGLAPFICGISTIAGLSWWLQQLFRSISEAHTAGSLFSIPQFYLSLFAVYCLFSVSNMMFSSKEDMQGVMPLLGVLGLIGAALYVSGLRIMATGQLESVVITLVSVLVRYLGYVLALNCIILLISFLLVAGMRKIRGKT